MIAQYILLGLLGLILLVLILPMGVRLNYSADGLVLKLVLGLVRLTLIPRKKGKKKEKKPKKPKKTKEKKPKASASASPKQPEQKKGGKLSGLSQYLPLLFELIGHFRRRLLMRHLTVLVNLAGDDPCDLALLYGKANGAVGAAIPLLERAFRIRRRDIQIFCDFLADETEVYVDLEVVACPLRLLTVSLRYGWKLLKTMWKLNTEKAV